MIIISESVFAMRYMMIGENEPNYIYGTMKDLLYKLFCEDLIHNENLQNEIIIIPIMFYSESNSINKHIIYDKNKFDYKIIISKNEKKYASFKIRKAFQIIDFLIKLKTLDFEINNIKNIIIKRWN